MDATQRPFLVSPEFAVYAERHGLFQLYERIIQELVITQPEDPLDAMIAILKRPNDDVPRIIIHGPPAAGKRTMCKLVSQRLRAVHVVPDELLGDEDSLAAQEAQSQLSGGKQVNDNTWAELIRERVSKSDCLNKGWVLEGFPRTKLQAVALQAAGVLPKHFVLLDVKDDVAAERSIGKKVDPVTGDVYHVTYDMPSKPDIVSRLVDGNSEREMTKDLLEYHKNIDGVLRCYPHITKTINADQPKTDVLALVLTFLCTKHRSSAPHMPRIVLLGPPGSGKNTQAALLAKKYNIVNVSCSQAIKQAVSDGSKMGEALKPYIDRKMMIPDALVMNVLKSRLGQLDCATKGWVLHGFPKTPTQAELLVDEGYEPNRVFFLDLSVDSVMERLTMRRLDPVTGERYHMQYNPPRHSYVADRLQIHPQDTEHAVQGRLRLYEANAEDLDEYFTQSQHLNADQDIHTVFELIESMLVNPIPKKLPPRVL